MYNNYMFYWYIDYDEIELLELISKKKFDDFIECSKMHAYSIIFVLKLLVEQNYNEY